jgi:hypothetical protein
VRSVLTGIVAAALALSSAGVALAASGQSPLTNPNPSSPLSPGVPQSSGLPTTTSAPSPTVINPTTTTADDTGLSGSTVLIIVLGALVILTAISLYIWRDARRRAPVRHRAAAAADGPGGRPGSKPKAKPRKLSPAERRRRKRGRAR